MTIFFFFFALQLQANWQHIQGNGYSAFEDGMNSNDPYGLMPGSGKGRGKKPKALGGKLSRERYEKLHWKDKEKEKIDLHNRRVNLNEHQKKGLDDYWAKKDAERQKEIDNEKHIKSLSAEEQTAVSQAKLACAQFMAREVELFVSNKISFRELRLRYRDLLREYSPRVQAALHIEELFVYMKDMSTVYDVLSHSSESHYDGIAEDPLPIKRGELPKMGEATKAFEKAFGEKYSTSYRFEDLPQEVQTERRETKK